MEWSNYINPIFIVHNSLYSALVNILRDACCYGYTALPNCFYLVNNVFNFNVFLLSLSLSLSLPLFPFVRGEVMPATFSLPHLLVFSTLLCLVSSSSSLPPLLPSSHLSLHSPPISALASLVSSCPALVTLPLSSVIGHRPSFLRVQPTVICS